MAYVNHLQGANPENNTLTVAFGLHVVKGFVAKSNTAGADVFVEQILGEGFGRGWSGFTNGIWFDGVRIDESRYTFHPGKMSTGASDPVQGVDALFPLDTPHSNTVWLTFAVPSDLAASYQSNQKTPPDKFSGIVKTQIGDIYSASGTLVSADIYLTNAADAAAFLCKQVRGYDDAAVGWASLAALRAYNEQTSTVDYRALPEGIGVGGKYFTGTNFNTFVTDRIDPVIEFDNSEGSPSFSIPVDFFSAEFEGFIRPRYSESYTFTVTADNGTRFWLNESLLIDQWSDDGQHAPGVYTASVTLAADEFYHFKLHWNEGGGAGAVQTAQIKLEWSSPSQGIEVVPQERLYPLDAALKNYECGVFIDEASDLNTALNLVLRQSNAFYQVSDGKINFYSFDTLAPSFHFDEDNIATDTFKTGLRYSQTELRNLPTRWQADGRDIRSQYLEPFVPEVYFDTPDLQQRDLGHIRVQSVPVGNCERFQALKIVTLEAKLKAQGIVASFEGTPGTYPVLPYDVVTLSWAKKGWVNKLFIALEGTDKSIDADADGRIFQLFEWEL